MLLSVTGFASSKTVQIRIYNKTTATEVVEWTATGVSERADGQGYSVYYYDYALVAGSEYIVDWKDNSTPVNTASEGISVLQSGVATIDGKIDAIDSILDTLKALFIIRETTVVDASPSKTVFETSLVEATIDYWKSGAIQWKVGTANAGVIRSIKSYVVANGEVTLNSPLPITPVNGDGFYIISARAFKLAGLEMQEIRDAMKLAPSSGDPVAGSIDKHVDDGALEATLNTKIPTALTFTGSDVKATLDGEEVTPTTLSKTGYALSAAGIQAIWDALTSAFTTVGSIGKKLADWVVGTIDTYTGNTKQTGDAFTRLGAPAGASVSADIAAIPTTSYTSTLTALSNAIAALQTDLGDPSVAETTIYAQILVLKAYVDELETRLTAERAIKLDYLNATISSRSTLTAQQVWEYATRTLSSFGTLIADIWAYATRTLTSFASLIPELISNISSGGVLASTITIVEDSPITIKRGDIKRLTFSFGSAWNLTGKKLYFCAKLNKADSNSTAIVNREVDLITDIANAGGYIDLTALETAKTGIYEAEFERRNTDGTSPETIWEGALIIEQDTRQ